MSDTIPPAIGSRWRFSPYRSFTVTSEPVWSPALLVWFVWGRSQFRNRSSVKLSPCHIDDLKVPAEPHSECTKLWYLKMLAGRS